MMGQLSNHVAQAVIDERLRSASERRASQSAASPVEPAAHHDMHWRQRALVQASLLLSRRGDRPTARRWA
jgi:hypothetical protein